MPVATLSTVVLDCPDPKALAGFYASVLGGTVEEDPSGWVELEGAGVALGFQHAPDHVPPQWPQEAQQFHLDLRVDDMDAAEEQVLALGAKALDAADRSRPWRVYADPAGHPFCLCAA